MKERRKRRNEDGNRSMVDDGSISNFRNSKIGLNDNQFKGAIKEVNES